MIPAVVVGGVGAAYLIAPEKTSKTVKIVARVASMTLGGAVFGGLLTLQAGFDIARVGSSNGAGIGLILLGIVIGSTLGFVVGVMAAAGYITIGVAHPAHAHAHALLPNTVNPANG